MKFIETPLKGAYVIEQTRVEDERGFFSRSWCDTEFEEHGLVSKLVQCNISFNAKKGTLRGMHFQAAPFGETKLVRCTMGSIYDVIVDIRPESPTYTKWFGVELSDQNRTMLYIPEGFAHGFITLKDNSEVFYQMSNYYSGPHARGLPWNDPAFAIKWPFEPAVISARDQAHPRFAPERR